MYNPQDLSVDFGRKVERLITTGLATRSIKKGNLSEEEYMYAIKTSISA